MWYTCAYNPTQSHLLQFYPKIVKTQNLFLNFRFNKTLPIDDSAFNPLTRAVKLFYTLAHLDGGILGEDSCLMEEWFKFNNEEFFVYEMKRFYT